MINMKQSHLLLVDDHAMFRSGLNMLLSVGVPEAQIVEASSLHDALENSMKHVDLVLLDIKLNGLSGLEGISLLRRKWPQVPILVLSSQDEPETVRLAQARGATGFVSKAETAEQIIATVKLVLCGEYSSFEVTPPSASRPYLTPRQSEVLNLLHQGLSNKVIARQLALSENTVRRHVQAILEFFGVASRAEAVFVARGQGIIG